MYIHIYREHRDAALQRDLDADAVQRGRAAAGVREGDAAHPQQRPALGLHTLQHPRLGQREARPLAGRLAPGDGLRAAPDELRHVAPVRLQPPLPDGDDVRADLG